VIVSAVRTPFGKLGGGLAGRQATELGAIAIRAALDRVDVEDGEVEYAIIGQVLQGGAGQAPARQAAVGAGLPISLPADTINKVCASSIRAVEIADQMIRSGDHAVIVAGGMESMSNAPYALPKARFGYKLGDGALVDLMVHDGLTSTFDGKHMVEQASFVSRELGITREAQDEWALRSHERAVAAQDEGRFADELVPVGEVTADEGPRRDTTLEKLASLQPAFKPDGKITAGNSSQISDGAAAVLLMSREKADALGLKPRARIVDQTTVGCDPVKMLEGPIPATAKILERNSMSINDIDLIEINEAFAPVVAAWQREHNPDMDRVNTRGGAMALGHPLGSTGARLITTLLHALEDREGGLGLVTMCCGGGIGTATLFERENGTAA